MAGQNEHAFQRLVLEAVEVCGTNTAAIEAYIEARQGAMTPAQRDAIRRDIELVLGFREPPAPYEIN